MIKKFEMTDSQKRQREKIRKSIIKEMKANNLYKEPLADMVERYMKLWDNCLMLEHDIETRGVQIETIKGDYKKNDSTVVLVNTNKQMLILLEKIGISATKVKADIGGSI